MPRHSGMADREPCPWRIVDDVGGAFSMGVIGGGLWHTVKGYRLSPKGAKWAGVSSAVTARAPVLGGQFAIWGGIFACCDCTLTSIRQKEDPWNAILSGAATGAILAGRAGPQAMASAGLVGGVLLALIEGMGIMISRSFAPPVPTAEDYERAMQQDVTAPPTAGGLSPAGGFRMGGGGGAPSPPPSHDPFSSTDSDGTTFRTEGSSSDGGGDSKGGSWFSFGSS